MTLLLLELSESLDCRCITFFLAVCLFWIFNEYEYFAYMHEYAYHICVVQLVVRWWLQNSWTWSNQQLWTPLYRINIYIANIFFFFLFSSFCFFRFFFVFVAVVAVVVVVWDRVSLYSSGCPRTHSVDQAGLELRNPPASPFQSAGITGVHHHRPACKYFHLSVCIYLKMHPIFVRSHYCYRLNWNTSGLWKMNRELKWMCNSL